MSHYLKAEVSLAAISHNVQQVRRRLPKGCTLCGVVKADAYGHGVAGVWETLAAATDMLAVATIAEALELRSLGYNGRLLLLMAPGAAAGGEQLEAVAEALAADVQLMITDPADAPVLARLARKLRKKPVVHMKIDTGMGRSGVVAADAPKLLAAIVKAPSVRLAGVCTHFAASDAADKTHADEQFALFTETLAQLTLPDGVVRHAAASAAVSDMPHTALDMARVGLALYGYHSSDELLHPMDLRPALRLTAPIMQVKRLPIGATCGYGCTRKLERDSRVGIVPAGYADGVSRILSNRCPVGLGDALTPALGRVSMDQIMIDLTDHPEIGLGRRVELISPDLESPASVANLARLAGTIPNEIICRLGRRIDYVTVDDFSPLSVRR